LLLLQIPIKHSISISIPAKVLHFRQHHPNQSTQTVKLASLREAPVFPAYVPDHDKENLLLLQCIRKHTASHRFPNCAVVAGTL
jgi:hypothetical protein